MSRSLIVSACAVLLVSLPGCGVVREAANQPVLQPTVDWRNVATPNDRRRLREWRSAWVEGLALAAAAGHQAEIAREGTLLHPDAAQMRALPPPGDYRCRTIKIGGQSPGMLDYLAYQPFACRITLEEGLLSFAKVSGSQRPVGLLFEDTDRRMVFLGTLQLGDERRALQYGRDRERDMAGVLERVDDRRWRLVFPYPHFESLIDVLELVPASS
ncbi:MAG: DUF4893 domain-containing protein [Allosphingosinicella sp.]|uniref:DUF4893 domain-containing protein n=1 Tax=Allosphingosinicella sp. TaxID=2823234 RepID=UPI003939FCE6